MGRLILQSCSKSQRLRDKLVKVEVGRPKLLEMWDSVLWTDDVTLQLKCKAEPFVSKPLSNLTVSMLLIDIT